MASAGGGTHVVASGESLTSIARLYGVPRTTLAETNKMDVNGSVRIGQRISHSRLRHAGGERRQARRSGGSGRARGCQAGHDRSGCRRHPGQAEGRQQAGGAGGPGRRQEHRRSLLR